MADRIFPNTYQEEPLDSDMVFKGIDWDNFNQKLAEVKNAPAPELPEEFKEVLAKKKTDDMPEEVEEMFKEKAEDERDEEDAEDLSDVPPQLRKHVKKKQDKKKHDEEDHEEDHEDEDKDDDEDEDDDKKPGKRKKKANKIVFTHPSQLSAEAVEAAIAAGDEPLKNAILAARQERRVRLASKIEAQIEAENEINTKLAQRRAYRESLVNKVVEASANKEAKTAKVEDNGFVKISEAKNNAKQAFAAKALAEGFPQEYVDAILGNNIVEVDNTEEIRNVMASDLSSNVKKSAVESMVRTATLTDADYSRLIRYWKEELGYGDQEWIDALFTKKYD